MREIRETHLAFTCLYLGAFIVLGGLTASESSAYERSTTSEGVEANWFTRCIPIWLNQVGSARISMVQVEQDVVSSIEEWEGVACADLTLVYQGLTASFDIGFDPTPDAPNQNLIIFQSSAGSWVHDSRAVGLTTVTMCQNDTPTCAAGTILDADIELNEVDFTLTASGTRNVQMDFANTLTHELGHFLGLDHSDDRESTMYAEAPLRETKKRTLNADDEAGACALFAQDDPRVCMLTPYDLTTGTSSGGGTDEMQVTQSSSGCRQTSDSSGGVWLIGLFLIALSRVCGPRQDMDLSHVYTV